MAMTAASRQRLFNASGTWRTSITLVIMISILLLRPLCFTGETYPPGLLEAASVAYKHLLVKISSHSRSPGAFNSPCHDLPERLTSGASSGILSDSPTETPPSWLDDLVHVDYERGRVFIDSVPEVGPDVMSHAWLLAFRGSVSFLHPLPTHICRGVVLAFEGGE